MSADVHWASGWYGRRRHVPLDMSAEHSPSLCSPYTGVYPRGRPQGAARVDVPLPPADSSEVMALPACSHCERLVVKGAAS